MKVSLNWLNEFVRIPVSPIELAHRLSVSGTEVESVQVVGSGITNVVSARIESIEKHPDADRLLITQVFDGTDTHQVVTGASNVFVGAIVPLSRVGATLAGGFKIKASKLRGVASNGMLCSESELGIASDSNGIWILPPDTPLGEDFAHYAQLEDTILEIGILPNRGDCQSMIGVAREVAALFDIPLTLPAVSLDTPQTGSNWAVLNQAPDFCLTYTARAMAQITVGPTPIWMQRRLLACAIRPINNIVDISNYVLLECGQPLHIFDSSAFLSHAIGIRYSEAGETIVTLDGVQRTLSDGIGVITDGSSPVAIAGIMGGEHSGVAPHTTSILIEAAVFTPSAIRKGVRSTGLRSESSARFEKGVDIDRVQWASERAATLVQSLAGGHAVGPLFRAREQALHHSPSAIAFNPNQINQLLGTEFSVNQMENALKKLGFVIQDTHAIVPSWRRHDIQEWPDLAEEIARIIGLAHIPSRLPTPVLPSLSPTLASTQKRVNWIEQLSERLTHLGFCETRSLPMVSPSDAAQCGQSLSPITTIQNPLTPHESVMAESHLPRLMNTVVYNINRQQSHLRFFEWGRVFQTHHDALAEQVELAGIVCGRETPADYSEPQHTPTLYRFSHLKSILESVLFPFSLVFSSGAQPNLHPTQQQSIRIGSCEIGYIGYLHPKLAAAFEVPASTLYFNLSISALALQEKPPLRFVAYSKFPSIRRDIAILAPKSLAYADIESVILANKSNWVSDVFLFDCYESEKLGLDNRSLAIGLIYQDLDKSLSDSDINDAHQQLVLALSTQLPISIR